MLDKKKRKSGGMKDGDDRSSKKQKSGLGTGSNEVTEEEFGTFLLRPFCYLLLTYHCRGLPDEPTDD